MHSVDEVSVVCAEKTLLVDGVDIQPSEGKSFFKLKFAHLHSVFEFHSEKLSEDFCICSFLHRL